MHDVTKILADIEAGNPHAAEDLLPIVYDELRKLAKARMANERSDHTLQSTALVHEAYVRLVDTELVQKWDSRGHFFSAAAESMRRILVEHARRKLGKQQGGDRERVDLDDGLLGKNQSPELVLQVNEALEQLTERDSEAAELIKLRFFAGMSVADAAETLGIPRTKVYESWSYAKAMLGRILA